MRLNTKAAISEFLKEHPTWVLQLCRGVKQTWWWVRNSETGNETVHCHASAARVIAKKMQRGTYDWRHITFTQPK